MSCSLVSRTRALFSFSSPTRKSKHSERVLEDEKAGIFLKERELRDSEDGEEYEDEEIQFPCPAFINTASKYIFPPTTSQYVPTPKTSSFSSTNHQSSSSPSSSSIASPSKTIDTTPLAQAFANLAVDAGIYGTRESYVEVLAFQLRRMVRSLAGQCMESKERCL
ncbi:hypothetical protein DL98DRAFT_588203 [Cadophora sp. DSE1049]|nr:hypothetical protein DL98DRAFT_588203 [Cadophora sp. DSE1049]